jgi:L-histidine N-alpha-methyltransferase
MPSRSSRTATPPRIRVDRLFDETDRRSALHDATFWGLRERPKEVPAVWLYDERGSRLFDEITRLPEYYPTRREREILVARADEIAARTAAKALVELGSGTSEKTRLLLDALETAGTLELFVPLDASEEILLESAVAVAERHPSVGVHAVVGDFERHLRSLPDAGGRLVAFLGSTIGNLEPRRRARFLAALGSVLTEGDFFLLGVDLVKAPERIVAAYNDSRGVTEAFVRNGLDALARELRADVDQRDFDYVARWDPGREWMDIGLRARRGLSIPVPELEVTLELASGEPLRFEVSTKFRREGIESELGAVGLGLDAWWTDAAGDFALALFSRSPAAEAR